MGVLGLDGCGYVRGGFLLVVAQWPVLPEEATEAAAANECEAETVQGRPYRISWARLLKRFFCYDIT